MKLQHTFQLTVLSEEPVLPALTVPTAYLIFFKETSRYRNLRNFGQTFNFELNLLCEINFFEGSYTVKKSLMALSTSGFNHQT